MNQDELKQAVARAAIDHLVDGAVVGVGNDLHVGNERADYPLAQGL